MSIDKSEGVLTPISIKRKRSVGDDGSFLGLLDVETPSRFIQTPTCSNSVSICPGLPTPLLSPADGTMASPDVTVTKSMPDSGQRKRKLQQTIQTQLGLEILLKHKELRLIDQELAKCQVALEQLRRCTEIPYPSTRLSNSVTDGNGPALRRHYGRYEPRYPAPWGVTDGPYTRHYSQWLLSSSQFDGGEPEPVFHTSAGKSPVTGRPIRASFTEGGKTSTKSRNHRGSALKSLPAGYGQPKEKATGPMILKRKSDGVMVKLVCPDCGRHDFGSAQGFINHCRIGHSRSFASHDAAAEACGEPVEYDESGTIKGVEPVQPQTSGNVHPLVRSARLLQSSVDSPTAEFVCQSVPTKRKVSISPDFRASTLTPHLSAFIGQSGIGLDLQEMVRDAKMKVELPESDSEDDEMVVTPPVRQNEGGRHPQTGAKTTSRQSVPSIGSKSMRSYDQHRESIQSNMSITNSARIDFSGVESNMDVHQAPSLVDDDDDFEPPSPTSMSVSEENEVDVRVRDDEEADNSNMTVADEPAPCSQQPVSPLRSHTRRPSAIRKHTETKEEKHVSFVNTTPSQQAAELARNEQRKRRKISAN